MKKTSILILSGLFFVFNSCSNSPEKINIMTYNIRLDTEADGINMWDNRKEGVLSIIKEESVDILGIQEGLPSQIDYLSKELDGYSMIGEGRDGGNNGEYSAIYYRNKKMNLIQTETFWLSETPEMPSIGWDAAINRIVTLGIFKIKKSKKELIVYNTHFDHIGKIAREKSVGVILNHIKENDFQNRPLIVMGDFNLSPEDLPIELLSKELNDSFKLFPVKNPVGTFNGFDLDCKLLDRIDYIFTKNIKITNYKHLNKKLSSGLWPSDHLPILISMFL
jgi:endonuclease/exonuclease/phosphatase family metal-dependent hydrolase